LSRQLDHWLLRQILEERWFGESLNGSSSSDDRHGDAFDRLADFLFRLRQGFANLLVGLTQCFTGLVTSLPQRLLDLVTGFRQYPLDLALGFKARTLGFLMRLMAGPMTGLNGPEHLVGTGLRMDTPGGH
jgi:hypothetical protein